MDWMSRLSAASNIIISSIILHTSFRMVCWPPYCPMYYTCEYYNAYVYFCLYIEKSPRSVDTERGNGYNTYRVRPKRSAVYKYVFSLIKGVTVLWQQGGYLCRNFMIVIVSISCLSARMSAIINSSILHTSFRMVCWPPLALGIILVNIIMLR